MPRVRAACRRAPEGLPRTAPGFQGWGSKHYHGHRERLRQRFLQGGEEAVADYELLELLLFFSVYRRDTKPIAKAMLQAFGGLGARARGRAGPLRRVPGARCPPMRRPSCARRATTTSASRRSC